jgi:hypothetical protein
LSQGVATRTRSASVAGALAWDGASYQTAWHEGQFGGEAIRGARLDPSGAFLAPPSTFVAGQSVARLAMLAATSTTVLAVWEDESPIGAAWDTVGARSSTAGRVLDPVPLALSAQANRQEGAVTAFDGTNYLWVWLDDRQLPGPGLYAERVSPSGSVLDAAPIRIGPFVAPFVAFDGSSYLVLWYGDGPNLDLFGVRVSTAGVLLDPEPVLLHSARPLCSLNVLVADYTSLSVACAPTSCIALSTDECVTATSTNSVARAIRIDPTNLAATTSTIATSTASIQDGAIDFDGTRYLAVWTDLHRLLGTRVSVAGGALDRAPLLIVTSTLSQISPQLASNGQGEMLIWDKNGALWTTRLSSAALALDGTGSLVTRSWSAQSPPFIIADGTAYWIAWNDQRHDPSGLEIYGFSTNSTSAIPLAVEPHDGLLSGMAHGPPGSAMLTYLRYDLSPGLESNRAYARIVSLTDSVPLPDAGATDNGRDASATDAGMLAEAGAPDAVVAADASASFDATSVDAGAGVDVTTGQDATAGHDATAGQDAVSADASRAASAQGCGCRDAPVTMTDGGSSVLLLLWLLVVRRRGATCAR